MLVHQCVIKMYILNCYTFLDRELIFKFFCWIINVLSNMRSTSLHSGKDKMFDVITETIEKDLPPFMADIFGYASNPGLIISAVLLMVWVVN